VGQLSTDPRDSGAEAPSALLLDAVLVLPTHSLSDPFRSV